MINHQLKPKFVTLPQLRKTLLKYTYGWTWAEDAIVDLWKKGAPAPQASMCPRKPPCPTLRCSHVQRILMPTQFAMWWLEVQSRMGLTQKTEDIHGKV